MRDDLLALTAERLTLLANAGLVKRAARELAEGRAPTLSQQGETVVASFADGARTELPLATALRDAPCTCGAGKTVCRHRIAAVLAYQKEHGNAAPASTSWSPADITDAQLKDAVGEGAFARAEKARDAGCVIATRSAELPTAQLPHCTVQFLVPNQPALARCDCAQAGRCEHVVLAVWAFRENREGIVELHGDKRAATATAPASSLSLVEPLVQRILQVGFAPMRGNEWLAELRQRMAHEGLTWMADALEDLEREKEAYERQSARFSARQSALLVAELVIRARAASHPGGLPAAYVLGTDARSLTPLDQLHLHGLCARLEADGRRRSAEVFVLDADTGQVLVAKKHWDTAEDAKPPEGFELGGRYISSRMSVAELATSEVIVRGARRHANGLLDLNVARSMKTLPRAADAKVTWPHGFEVTSLKSLAATLERQPPRLLRPRLLAESVRALKVASVRDVSFDSGEQAVIALLEDADGTPVELKKAFRSVSPGAVEAAIAMLDSQLTHALGFLTLGGEGWEMEPLALFGARRSVLELEPLPRKPVARPPEAGLAPRASFPLQPLEELVLRAVHHGQGAVLSRWHQEAERLAHHGWTRLATLAERAAAGSSQALLDLLVAWAFAIKER